MAAVTLYRFRIELSDLDRNVYDTLDFRVAMHPSETPDYLLTRVMAFALNEGVSFTAEGLSDPDQPALKREGLHGSIETWIEIGNPSARKLHRASKAAGVVRVYTYKDPRPLVNEAREIPRASSIEVFGLPNTFLSDLAERLERDCRWSLLVQDGVLTVTGEGFSVTGELRSIPLV